MSLRCGGGPAAAAAAAAPVYRSSGTMAALIRLRRHTLTPISLPAPPLPCGARGRCAGRVAPAAAAAWPHGALALGTGARRGGGGSRGGGGCGRCSSSRGVAVLTCAWDVRSDGGLGGHLSAASGDGGGRGAVGAGRDEKKAQVSDGAEGKGCEGRHDAAARLGRAGVASVRHGVGSAVFTCVPACPC
eukprot:350232-Chlamydomonas_euryale.AAC.7